MKNIFVFILFSVFLGCKEAIKNEVDSPKLAENIQFEQPKMTKNTIVYSLADLLGYWVGTFSQNLSDEELKLLDEKENFNYSKKITFSIDKIIEEKVNGKAIDVEKGKMIVGHSIVGGTIRLFKGKILENDSAFTILVDEPGDKSTDGKFSLYIMKKDSTMYGGWVANSKTSVPIHTKKLELNKRFFRYNPNDELEDGFVDFQKTKKMQSTYEEEDSLGNFVETPYEGDGYFTTTDTIYSLNPSKELLKKELVENLTKGDIYILRNLIFARHGFTFRDQKLREYFDNHSWYMPVYSDVKKALTNIEKKNIDLLLRYEQNAKEYYDVFGR